MRSPCRLLDQVDKVVTVIVDQVLERTRAYYNNSVIT